ncbi:membrane protein [Streptomyces humidus]|uniref:Membrane protein n=1 Tax=Streptomyces humidus TaxID=52259 RepID=A0A918L2W9_9ACTN|nr:SHOCT domain-containing protein [Streptomyces humidus]GGR84058.1 membrane protein [Streptomyces humidus]
MTLAYDYPVPGVFWTTMWIFLWILWFVLLFRIIGDVFRDDSLGGGAKTGWLVFVILLPFLGVFVYVVARGKETGTRERQHAQARQQAFDEHIRETARGGGAESASEAEQLAKLSEIRSKGDITEDEFRLAREKILH